jgi:hypothetical protein
MSEQLPTDYLTEETQTYIRRIRKYLDMIDGLAGTSGNDVNYYHFKKQGNIIDLIHTFFMLIQSIKDNKHKHAKLDITQKCIANKDVNVSIYEFILMFNGNDIITNRDN